MRTYVNIKFTKIDARLLALLLSAIKGQRSSRRISVK